MIFTLKTLIGFQTVAALRSAERRLKVRELLAYTETTEAFQQGVCRELVSAGILKSHRGKHGGYTLPSEHVRFVEVIKALDDNILLKHEKHTDGISAMVEDLEFLIEEWCSTMSILSFNGRAVANQGASF